MLSSASQVGLKPLKCNAVDAKASPESLRGPEKTERGQLCLKDTETIYLYLQRMTVGL